MNTLQNPRRWSWYTHLFMGAIALIAALQTAGQLPSREVLNSERIAAKFGSYGVDVLEQDEGVRISNLFSGAGDSRICRTFAVVQYASGMDPVLSQPHAAIIAGGSIGAVFAAQGWEVRKTHLRYGERAASAKLSSLMRIEAGTPLAHHVYVLDVVKDGHVFEYAALVEIHHPAYLDAIQLREIYGPADDTGRRELVAALLDTADDRSR